MPENIDGDLAIESRYPHALIADGRRVTTDGRRMHWSTGADAEEPYGLTREGGRLPARSEGVPPLPNDLFDDARRSDREGPIGIQALRDVVAIFHRTAQVVITTTNMVEAKMERGHEKHQRTICITGGGPVVFDTPRLQIVAINARYLLAAVTWIGGSCDLWTRGPQDIAVVTRAGATLDTTDRGALIMPVRL